MKKKVYSIIGLTIFCAICCCALTGCSPEQIEGLEDTDLIWIAEEHPLYFKKQTPAEGHGGRHIGKAMRGEKAQDIYFDFWNGYKRGARISIYEYDIDLGELSPSWYKNKLLVGKCYQIERFHCEIQIDQKYNVLVPSSIPVLNIRAYRIDEIEWVDGWPVPNTKAND